MVSKFAMDLFQDPFFIGFNRELERFNTVHNLATRQAYPPYDIIKVDEDTYKLSLAVAGLDKENLNVSVDNGTLIIKGETNDTEEGEVVHKGIASRKFTRTFALGEYLEVTGAEICCGMLNINIERIVPEDKKPKTIEIK